MKKFKKTLIILSTVALTFGGVLSSLTSCQIPEEVQKKVLSIENGDELNLEIGNTRQLRVNTKNINGRISYNSSNENVATIDENGLIHAKEVGETIIKAFFEEVEDTIKVNVISGLITPTPSIIINCGTPYDIEKDKEAVIEYTIANTSEIPFITISDESIVQILSTSNSQVRLKGLKVGEATLTIGFDDNLKQEIVIKVIEKSNVNISISIGADEFKTGTSFDINVDVTPESLIDDVEFNILSGRDLVEIKGTKVTTLRSGVVKLCASLGNAKSNELTFAIYDFSVVPNKSKVSAGEKIYIDISDYDGDSKTELEPVLSNSSIGKCYYDEQKNKYIFEAEQVGETLLFLRDPNYIRSNTIKIIVEKGDPYLNTTKEEFYKNYERATNYQDAMYRTNHYFMSGNIYAQDQKPTIANDQLKVGDKFVHNSERKYSNSGQTYTVVNSKGEDAFEIYKNAAYTTLEEVAAYIYAFGDVPPNYDKNKKASPRNSPWGEYLRVNNTYFNGDVDAYPYEPKLPNISGIGGNLKYYEIDIGTTGTDCDPNYVPGIYNDGDDITRGAARIVYSRYYLDTQEPVRPEDRYVFYTYNHYNDFQEYLNYENGWGEMFGNITGGGKISSKVDYNPTPYVEVVRTSLK